MTIACALLRHSTHFNDVYSYMFNLYCHYLYQSRGHEQQSTRPHIFCAEEHLDAYYVSRLWSSAARCAPRGGEDVCTYCQTAIWGNVWKSVFLCDVCCYGSANGM